MATAAKLVERIDADTIRVTWTVVAVGDDGSPVKIPSHSKATFQAVGGSTDAGTTLALVGTNLSVAGAVPTPPGTISSPWAIETAGTTFGVVDDDDGNPISTTLGTIPTVVFGSERLPLWVKPTLTAAAAANVVCILVIRVGNRAI